MFQWFTENRGGGTNPNATAQFSSGQVSRAVPSDLVYASAIRLVVILLHA